ncbi:MAG TPA: DUF2277 domain-containing protein [Gemmatimonadaceae bacterium]|jgi:hypothetical protein
MCRNIRPLYNFEPATTPDEIRNAAVQFVRKVSGMSKPSKANEPAFNKAVDEVSHSIQHLLGSLVTTAAPRSREVEAAKGRARSEARFARIAQTFAKTEA